MVPMGEHPAAIGQGDESVAGIESGSTNVQWVYDDGHGAHAFIGQPQAPQQGVHQPELSRPQAMDGAGCIGH